MEEWEVLEAERAEVAVEVVVYPVSEAAVYPVSGAVAVYPVLGREGSYDELNGGRVVALRFGDPWARRQYSFLSPCFYGRVVQGTVRDHCTFRAIYNLFFVKGARSAATGLVDL